MAANQIRYSELIDLAPIYTNHDFIRQLDRNEDEQILVKSTCAYCGYRRLPFSGNSEWLSIAYRRKMWPRCPLQCS
jgi:hypothetical protein